MSVDNEDKCLHNAGMTMRDQIIAVAETYASAMGIGRKRVSTLVLNRSSKLDDIINGGDLNTGTFERAIQWFSDRWPSGLDWPEGVDRPCPATQEAAE